jgi:hypothetical protein
MLTIYLDGVEQEKLSLQGLATEEEMHQLMLAKGFVLKTEDELEEVKLRTEEERRKEEEKKERIKQKQEEKRQRILNAQKDAANNMDVETKDESEALKLKIKELRESGGDPKLIKKLTRERARLAQETMMKTQAKVEKEDKTEQLEEGIVNEKPQQQQEQQEQTVGSDEL